MNISKLWLLLLVVVTACSPAPPATPTTTPAPSPTPIIGSLIGRPITSGTAQVYRVMEDGTLRHIPDTQTLTALAYEAHDIVTIPADRLTSYPLAMPLARWLTGKTDHDLYYLLRGKRYLITEAQLTLTGGTPTEVALVEDVYLHSFPLAKEPLEGGDLVSPTVAAEDTRMVTVQGSDRWIADPNFYDFTLRQYHIGRGLIHRSADGIEQIFTRDPSPNDPLKSITTMASNANGSTLWIGTRFAGLLTLNLNSIDSSIEKWTLINRFNSRLGDNRINRLWITADGTIWAAAPAGMLRFDGQAWHTYPVPGDITDRGVLAFAVNRDNSVWAAGENFVGKVTVEGNWTLYSAFEHPLLLDRFHTVVINALGEVTFKGDKATLRHDTQGWLAVKTPDSIGIRFDPAAPDYADGPNFPDPTKDYRGWLKAWPRPDNDNGRGIHYLAYPSNDRFELNVNVERLKQLGVRWLLVNYTSRSQLPLMAPVFKAAGIMVIWRPFVRPYREYPYWAKDVAFLRGMGLPPYIQIYNEPSLGQEWEDDHRQIDQQLYLKHLLPAIREVYKAGGYVGLQEIDMNWLRTDLQEIKSRGDSVVFPRMFFIPHAYGYNHPPDFELDANSVLGFREFAKIFEAEVGFTPIMIAGEGGWRPGEAQDIRYPMVTQTRHRDYLIAVYNWFQTGTLSNGDPLPDYFFGFCAWILADPTDAAAWYDGRAGNRDLLIQAVKALPRFTR